MANIRFDFRRAPLDGQVVTFKAPCNASDISGLIIYYPNENSEIVSTEFTLNDANIGDIGVVDNIFAEGAIVKVILDTDTNNAYVQNPDTNTYIEGRFDTLQEYVDAVSSGKADEDHEHSNYETIEDATSKLIEAKAYADEIKDSLLNGAGEAYDTLKELGDLINENVDAIEALEIIATNKQDKTLVVTKNSGNLASHTPAEILAYSQNGADVVYYDGGTYHTFLEGNTNTAVFYSSYINASKIQFTVYQIYANKTIEGTRSSYTPPVTSVNSKTGKITLSAADVQADAAGSAQQALDEAKAYTDAAADINKSAIEANEAAIALKASQEDLTYVSDRVTTLESWHNDFAEISEEDITALFA